MYGKMLKLTELSHFLGRFWPSQNHVLALKSEPLDQIRRNFQFSKHKEFLKRWKRQLHATSFWVKEMAKTPNTLNLPLPIARWGFQYCTPNPYHVDMQ